MMRFPSILTMVLFSTYLSTVFSMSLKRHYRRPICEPSQSCSYGYQQFIFELCDCPNMQSCPTDNGVQLKGITYQFCSARELPECQFQEIAAEVHILQTSIYCVCPRNQIYVKQKDISKASSSYVCQEKAICDLGQTCGVGNPIIGIKSICQCGRNQICSPRSTEMYNPLSIQNATCQSQI